MTLTPEGWQSVKAVLAAALARPPAERPALVERACGMDVGLRRQVEALIGAAERADSSLEVPEPWRAEAIEAQRPTPADSISLTASETTRLATALTGRYTIARELGRGGMATVYLASDIRHNRQVALKVLHPSLSALLGPSRFRLEIETAANMSHPHILPLFDSGEADGFLYYTMPYINGQSLRERLRSLGGPLPLADAVRMVRDVASALAYAHRYGLVHRDIKPANILLDEDRAVVADFGIARAVRRARATKGPDSGGRRPSDETNTLTEPGETPGTPAYMAPEQARYDEAVDHRADLYALGVVAYETLTGSHPFAGRSAGALVVAHATELPEPLARRCPSVPSDVAALVMHLLQKRPADRPQSADDVLRALGALNLEAGRNAAALHEHVAPSSALASWPQASHRRLAKMIGSAALVVAAAGGMWFYLRHSTSSVETLEVPARVLVVPFENATGDAALTPFGRMAADWVAQGLAHIGSIQVITEFGRRAANDSGLKSVATENGAGTVVSGTYYLDGDSLRLQTRVTDVGRWTLLRAVPPMSAPRAAPMALLEPLRQRVMAVVAVTRDPRASEWNFGAPPPTYAAYEQFLSGLDLFEAGDFLGGISYWNRAAALDSAYVQPILHISQAYFNAGRDADADSVAHLLERRRTTLTPFDRGFLDYMRGLIDGHNGAALAGARAMVRATPGTQLPHLLDAYTAVAANYPHEALREAAKLSYPFGRFKTPWSAQVYWQIVTTGLHMLDDHSAELGAAQRERKNLPENPEALANELRALAALGRIQEMEPGLEELQGLPVLPQGRSVIALQVSLADELGAHGRPEAAQRLLRRAVAWQHSRPTEERASASSREDIVAVLIRLGDEGAAQSLVTELLTEQPENGRYQIDQALLFARTGRRQEAKQFAERLRRSTPAYDRGRITYALAQIAAQVGDTVGAVTLVRQALAEGMASGLSLHTDPYLTPLRADPLFQSLRKPRD